MTTASTLQLADLLRKAAASIGATIADTLSHLTGNRFNLEVFSEAISGNALTRHEGDLPQQVASVQLDGIPVILGTLVGPPGKPNIDPQLRRYRNQATIARSWLGAEALNLQLFLAGPTGALRDPEWRQLAAEIEADDRICRKIVWLFDASPNVDAARAFLERTFVARPWPIYQRTELLDSMANLSLPEGWEEAIQDPDLDFNGLVERLIGQEREAAT